MPWLSKKRLAAMETRMANLENPDTPLDAGDSDADLYSRMASDGLAVPAVWSAINFIGGVIASLPLKVYRIGDDDERVEYKHSPVYKMLHDAPNDTTTSYDWRLAGMYDALYRGRWLSYIERDKSGRVANLFPLSFDRVEVDLHKGRYRYKTIPNPGSGKKPKIYMQHEILDIRFLPVPDRTITKAPRDVLLDSFKLSNYLRHYASRHFQSGGLPIAVLEGPFSTAKSVIKASQEIMSAIRQAWRKNTGILPLPLGHALKTLNQNPEGSQMIESRRFEIEEVARIYQLSPIFLQDLTKSTYSNTEQAATQLETLTLKRWLTQIEQEINLKFWGRSRDRMYVQFDLYDLTRGDASTRARANAVMIQTGQRTPNEVRALDNLGPVDGGDKIYMQANLGKAIDMPNVDPGTPSPGD